MVFIAQNLTMRNQLRASEKHSCATRWLIRWSMIPKEKSYKSHKANFEAVTHALGVGQTHGLRHGYAQTRYRELMGFDCPAVGGSRSLSADEQVKDKEIRMLISEELGHSRINITSVYLGSWSKN